MSSADIGDAALAILAMVMSVVGVVFKKDSNERKEYEKTESERAELRAKENALAIKMMAASISLGAATALALKEGYTNGDMEEALEGAKKAKEEYFQFINSVAAERFK